MSLRFPLRSHSQNLLKGVCEVCIDLEELSLISYGNYIVLFMLCCSSMTHRRYMTHFRYDSLSVSMTDSAGIFVGSSRPFNRIIPKLAVLCNNKELLLRIRSV